MIFIIVKANDMRVSVRCDLTKGIVVVFTPEKAFYGRIYVRDFLDNPKCSNSYNGVLSMTLVIPIEDCGTVKRVDSFSNVIIAQRNPFLVTASDSAYEVICQPSVDLEKEFTKETSAEIGPIPTSAVYSATSAPPSIYMNIYDFRKDNYVRNVRLGEVYELEIDVISNIYGGFARRCIAKSETGQNYTILDERGCPTDARIFDKAYVDDQSQSTGHYYIYMPFEVFRFVQGNKVTFQCDVVICRGSCQPVDCGGNIKLSYGKRKKRSAIYKENNFDENFQNRNNYLTTTSIINEENFEKIDSEDESLDSNIDDETDIMEKPVWQTINVLPEGQALQKAINDEGPVTYIREEAGGGLFGKRNFHLKVVLMLSTLATLLIISFGFNIVLIYKQKFVRFCKSSQQQQELQYSYARNGSNKSGQGEDPQEIFNNHSVPRYYHDTQNYG